MDIEELARRLQNGQSIHIRITKGNATFDEVLQLLIDLNSAIKQTTGLPMPITNVKEYWMTDQRGEYNLLAGTPYEEHEIQMEEAIFQENVKRQEVYDTISRRGGDLANDLRKYLDNKWPKKQFEDEFPLWATLIDLYDILK